ncbi:MAG: DNA helicase UvrD [Pseudonocardiales bacterium]|nr:MAG: DNA helicase UvrD [Pseudonocardiales bacterium]
MTGPRITPAELARRFGLPPPTPEQARVIAAPLRPAVVVAGAGSGKTETMASRVLWLVATGQAAPERVLGLTFTVKAAAELADRLRSRLRQLAAVMPETPATGEPTVLTYHSYAAQIVGEHALRVAIEPSSRLLTQAASWQVAQSIVSTYTGPMDGIDWKPPTVIDYVLALAAEMNEHLVSADELRQETVALRDSIISLPRSGKSTALMSNLKEPVVACERRLRLLPIVSLYQEAKRESGVLDFGDQLAIAARIASTVDRVGELERSRYDVVLLDEYQDTSHAQLVLMRSLFGAGHAVTAVGDPCQSIYGWRGASAGNLSQFATEFTSRGGGRTEELPLSISFRNDRRILDVANMISSPLRDSGVHVTELSLGPAGGEGVVRAGLFETVADEATWIADEIASIWAADAPARAVRKQGRSVAVLARRRSDFDRLGVALRARGVPVEMVDLGGLLTTPEVRDVVATLQVLADMAAGAALLHLLTGARWRIGPRDLQALRRRADSLARQADPGESQPDETTSLVGDPVADASIIEALDNLGPPVRYSAEGLRRMRALAAELRGLRSRLSTPLPDLVADVERTIGVDVEVVAAGVERVHLDRFLDVAAEFTQDADVATLSAFLAYLTVAEDEERGLEPGSVVVDSARVQVLTVHAAKGLEWDVVAVPGLTRDVFPAKNAVNDLWITHAQDLPYPLRGDAAYLPVLDLSAVRDQSECADEIARLANACKARGRLEERRLAYVAVTRARQVLLCSGYWWGTGVKRSRGPSEFLDDVRAAGAEIACWTGDPGPDAVNPLDEIDASIGWPFDPLGSRRAGQQSGADLVRAAKWEPAGEIGQVELFDAEALEWSADVELLLAEWLAPRATTIDVPLPGELSVSALVALRRDPASLARRIRRPVPMKPAPLARRGTAFHAWLEQRFGVAKLLDIDQLPGATDEGAVDVDDLVALQAAFLQSSWAARRPVEVEVPFEARIGGLVVRGRIDAVFADDDGGQTVVDWKTGRQPRGADMRAAVVQLAAYRVAWSALSGTPVERVRAAFHYVRSGNTVAPVDLLDADGLAGLVGAIPALAGQ